LLPKHGTWKKKRYKNVALGEATPEKFLFLPLHVWIQVHVSFLPHYFLHKKSTGTTQWACDLHNKNKQYQPRGLLSSNTEAMSSRSSLILWHDCIMHCTVMAW
jgi:hypothetical protein